MSKTLFIILFFCSIIANCFAQKNLFKIRGTVQIDNGTLMKETEVSLQEWMNFIVNNNFDESLFPNSKAITKTTKLLFDDLKLQGDFEYLKIVNFFDEKEVEPTRNFNKLISADTNYFSLNLPVTGITFDQAQRFCKWKENVLNEFKKNKVKVTVNLPSIEIYKSVITNIDSLTLNKKCYVLNCSTTKCRTEEKDDGDRKNKQMSTQGMGLESVISYFPTALGLYNLQGNAAEMTDSYGIAMGGSFRQTARESYNDRRQVYAKAEDWVGFRYVIRAK